MPHDHNRRPLSYLVKQQSHSTQQTTNAVTLPSLTLLPKEAKSILVLTLVLNLVRYNKSSRSPIHPPKNVTNQGRVDTVLLDGWMDGWMERVVLGA